MSFNCCPFDSSSKEVKKNLKKKNKFSRSFLTFTNVFRRPIIYSSVNNAINAISRASDTRLLNYYFFQPLDTLWTVYNTFFFSSNLLFIMCKMCNTWNWRVSSFERCKTKESLYSLFFGHFESVRSIVIHRVLFKYTWTSVSVVDGAVCV